MASFSDTVKVLIDVDSTGAVSGLANFRKSFSEAETATDKFKTVTGGAFDAIKNNAGTLALGAGTAIAGFAMKAIGDFQDMALAVDDFRNKTNLTLDQSSRWNALADDLGVPSDAITKIFDKLGKAADQQIPAFDRLGVAVQFGPDGATDIEATFLKVISKLQEIEDPAARAKIQADLFGKGWTNAAELINMSADDIQKALEGVGEAEIIDQEEIEKAKDLRAAQDELGDAFAALSLTLGEALIPALTDATKVIVPLMDALSPLVEVLGKGADANSSYAEQASNNNIQMRTGIGLAEEIFGWFGWGKDKTKELTDENYKLLASWILSNDAVKDITRSTDDLTTAFEDVEDALADLKGEVDERTEWRNLQDEFDNVVDAAITAFTEGTPAAIRDSDQALDDLRVQVGEYITETANIPVDKKTKFLAEIPTADLDRLKAIFDELARDRTVTFIPVAAPGAGGINEIGSGGRPIGEAPLPRPTGRTPRIAEFGSSTAGSVTVNVGGSVVTQTDLVEQIRLGLISAQRSGKQLVYTGP